MNSSIKITLFTALTLGVGGCGTSISPTATPATPACAPVDVAEHWHATRDYYALLELVDSHLDPQWNGKVSKADVVKYLGEDMRDRDYPRAGPNLWVYPSARPVPAGSYLFITFGDDGFVTQISWGSE